MILLPSCVTIEHREEDFMGEHVMHKKEPKKAPQKTLKEKREDKKNKKKGPSTNIPTP